MVLVEVFNSCCPVLSLKRSVFCILCTVVSPIIKYSKSPVIWHKWGMGGCWISKYSGYLRLVVFSWTQRGGWRWPDSEQRPPCASFPSHLPASSQLEIPVNRVFWVVESWITPYFLKQGFQNLVGLLPTKGKPGTLAPCTSDATAYSLTLQWEKKWWLLNQAG